MEIDQSKEAIIKEHDPALEVKKVINYGWDGSDKTRVSVDSNGYVNVNSSVSKTINEYTITLTSADTEYSQTIPSNTKQLTFQCRDYNAIRFAFTSGKVAGPKEPYFTLESGQTFTLSHLDLTSKTIYFASSTAGAVVELIITN